MLRMIVSGGQTGADRGALDAAIATGVPHGGHCPKGRRSEDGVIPTRYDLCETASSRYEIRTEQNVLNSDGTLLITRGEPRGGSALTERLALRHRKPYLHFDLDGESRFVPEVSSWLATERIECLNVAGPRESGSPGMADQVAYLIASLIDHVSAA
jgi:hypothetical protein